MLERLLGQLERLVRRLRPQRQAREAHVSVAMARRLSITAE
jgi:hypothetical protein